MHCVRSRAKRKKNATFLIIKFSNCICCIQWQSKLQENRRVNNLALCVCVCIMYAAGQAARKRPGQASNEILCYYYQSVGHYSASRVSEGLL